MAAASASAALTPIRRPVGRDDAAARSGRRDPHPAGARTRVDARDRAPRGAAARRVELRPVALVRLALEPSQRPSPRARVAYLAQLARLQDAAVAQVRAAIPQAQIQERFSILLDGFTVQLPARSLPKLLGVRAVTKVYPSLSYYATMDRGPTRDPRDRPRGGDRRQGPGHQDRRRRHRRRLDRARSSTPPASRTRRASRKGDTQAHDAQGDRREGVPRPGARREEHQGVRRDRAARHARLRHRRR